MLKHLQDNIAEATRFVKLLDPTATKFEFRTFDDNHDRDDKELLKTFYGTLAEHAAELQRLNRKGAGIFVIINETDGKGRKAENIIRIRAVFADLDGAPLAPVMATKCPPHILVKSSPGKFHVPPVPRWVYGGHYIRQNI
jgi:putative DNA primase/helicase